MSFRQIFKKSNNMCEDAEKFAACSCFANKKNNALFFGYCLLCSVCFFVFGYFFIYLLGIIGIIILNLIALNKYLIGCKFMRKSQSA